MSVCICLCMSLSVCSSVCLAAVYLPFFYLSFFYFHFSFFFALTVLGVGQSSDRRWLQETWSHGSIYRPSYHDANISLQVRIYVLSQIHIHWGKIFIFFPIFFISIFYFLSFCLTLVFVLLKSCYFLLIMHDIIVINNNASIIIWH